ncbi:DNA translocase FtsK 4TM domain-containing protein [Roseomonas sp. NAR14]|uniref:DNA translocase FtsK n=1 Tax=Roseomonas acroporae TaxID=2937791 RepID=A0A9X2BTV3_9PROT|nr:DNA translocase FtsK 4TM domain-containing protein [Roseomonas acroporae]MCK8784722.1 DNA translocase FtsK 4TM domain-containing protein [Roseomonas acroporae]
MSRTALGRSAPGRPLASRLPGARAFASPAVRAILRRRAWEVMGLLLGLAGLVLLVALASHDPADPSLSTATARQPTNLAGPIGAVASDLLLQGFGFAGALPAFCLLVWASRLAMHRGLGVVPARIAGLLASLPLAAATLALAPLPAAAPTEVGPGGAAGPIVVRAMRDLFGGWFGPLGQLVAEVTLVLGALLAVFVASGLSAGEWGRAGRATIGGGRFLGRFLGRAARRGRGPVPMAPSDPGEERRARVRRAAAPAMVPEAAPRRPALLGWFRNPLGDLFAPRARRPLRGEPAAPLAEILRGAELAIDDRAAPAFEPPAAAAAPGGPAASRPAARPATGAAVGSPPAARAMHDEDELRPPPPPVVPAKDDRRPAPARPAPPRGAAPAAENRWTLPPLELLVAPPAKRVGRPSDEALQQTARLLESVLEDYGVRGRIGEIRPGPVVTLYELEPAPGTKSARVIGLADDIARSMCVTAVRIATVPGRNVIGVEMPNNKRETVYLTELLDGPDWRQHPGRLNLALGKDIGGGPVIADLARMPHLLIAGTTGSGKSVAINTMILSLLYRLSPDECRFIMIDPKMLELSVYDRIPHLLAPVVTEPAKAIGALKWTVREMEKRYRAMSQLSVRNIAGYNEKVQAARSRGEMLTRRVQTGFDPDTGKPVFEEQSLALEPLPMIVVVIDEMADLMIVAGKEIEAAVQRLAQMARAAGIHVIMATQRPSVDVITGTIKANFPTRISFQVTSKIDSRTILGEMGAEQLLGQGDMLHMAGGGRVSRVHGPYVSDDEVERVVEFLREQGEPAYIEEVTEAEEELDGEGGGAGIAGASDGEKNLFDRAVDLVSREGKCSTSFIQRHLAIGYNRAAKLVEQMEKEGIVGPSNHVGKREVLARRTED